MGWVPYASHVQSITVPYQRDLTPGKSEMDQMYDVRQALETTRDVQTAFIKIKLSSVISRGLRSKMSSDNSYCNEIRAWFLRCTEWFSSDGNHFNWLTQYVSSRNIKKSIAHTRIVNFWWKENKLRAVWILRPFFWFIQNCLIMNENAKRGM